MTLPRGRVIVPLVGFFKALGKLGKATVGTVMLPVDLARDTFDFDPRHEIGHYTERRAGKIARNVKRALDEIDE